MSAILGFYDVYKFVTYMNGFLDLEYPNFDSKHCFLSSVEAEKKAFAKEGSHFHKWIPRA